MCESLLFLLCRYDCPAHASQSFRKGRRLPPVLSLWEFCDTDQHGGGRLRAYCTAASLPSLCIGAMYESRPACRDAALFVGGGYSRTACAARSGGRGVSYAGGALCRAERWRGAGADDSRHYGAASSCSLTRHRARWADKTSNGSVPARSV